MELRKSGTADGALYELGSIFGLGVPSTALGGIATLTGAGFTGIVLDPGSFSVLIRALETQNRGRMLIRVSILRSQSFEDLRYASQRPLREAGIESGWPTMRPRIIR